MLKRATFFAFGVLFLLPFCSYAELNVNPDSPFSLTNGKVIYPALIASDSFSPSFVDTGAGFSPVYVHNSASLVYLNVGIGSGFTPASGETIVIAVEATNSSGTAVTIPISSLNGNGCGAVNSGCYGFSGSAYRTASIAENTTARIGISPYYICNDPAGGGTRPSGCILNGGNYYLYTDNSTQQVSLKVVVGKVSNTSTVITSTDSGVETESLSLVFQNAVPSVADDSTQLNSIYTPADSKIIVNTGAIAADISSVSSALLDQFIVVSSLSTGTLPVPSATNSLALESQYTIVQRLPYNSGKREVSGFSNTSNGANNTYGVRFMIRDKAGLVTPLQYTLYPVQTTEIQGFLKENKCFIATAVGGGNDYWGLTTLREFRDEILLHYSFGRKFVEAYESFSPPLANWILSHPWSRFPVLILLTPIQGLAWMALHPFLFNLFALFSGMFLLSAWARYRGNRSSFRTKTFLLLLIFMSPHFAKAEESQTPFIDRIKKKMEPVPERSVIEEVQNTPQENIIPSDSKTPTIDRMKRKAEENSQKKSPRPTLEEEQQNLLNEKAYAPGGAIEAVKTGKSDLEMKIDQKTNYAASLAMGVSQTHGVTAVSGKSKQNFDTIYGKSWTPDVRMGFEYQLFHSENMGSLGLVTGFGFSTFKGKGVYEYTLNNPATGKSFGSSSNVAYRFSMVPLSLGANYRFNLARIFRPYVMGAPTGVVYWETSDDGRGTKRGFSTGINLSVGVAVLLNPFSQTSTYELNQSLGVTRYYVTAEYNRLQTFSGDVRFEVSGLLAGLTFEY